MRAKTSKLTDAAVLAAPSVDLRELLQVLAIITAAALCYFLAAWFRYNAFRAGAFDLGIFDQSLYLISQDKTPFSMLVGSHIIADHAAVIFYAIGQLYRIHPTVCWLFLIQAGCLAGAAYPLWRLARDAGAKKGMAQALIIAYLLYPVVAMAALRDFYPELLVLPAALAMILCARRRKFGWFLFWLALSLSTKEVMAITFGATGVYLALFERRIMYGVVCTAVSAAWFVVATHIIIPHFGHGLQLDTLQFYNYMGHTQGQVLRTMVLMPWVPLKMAFQKHTAYYFAALLIPIIWGLSLRNLAPLLCAAPCILLNVISSKGAFSDPTYHYTFAAVPFIFLAVVQTITASDAWFVRERSVLAWALVLVAVGVAMRGRDANWAQIASGASNAEKHRVVEMINDEGGVITTHQLVPHLSHRQVIQFVHDPDGMGKAMPPESQVEWVLLDFNEDSALAALDVCNATLYKYQMDPAFKEIYHTGALYLLHREGGALAVGSVTFRSQGWDRRLSFLSESGIAFGY